MPTYYSKIVEAIVAGSGALILSNILNTYGDKVSDLLFLPSFKPGFAAAGVFLGLLCGGFLSLCFLVVIYKIYQISLHDLLKRDDTRVFERFGAILKEMVYTILITTIPVFFFKIYRIINITLYQNSFPSDKKIEGIRLIGSYYGKILLLIFLCTTLILGFLNSGMGRIKKAYLQQKIKLTKRYYLEDIKGFLISSVIFSLLLGIGSQYLLAFLFHTVTVYEIHMLQIGAVGVLLITLSTYNYYILSAINKNAQNLIIFLIAFIVQTVGIIITLKTTASVYSIIIAELLFWGVTLILQILYFSKLLHLFYRDV